MYIPNADGSLRLTNVPVLSPEQLIEDYRVGKKSIGGWHYSYLLALVKQILTDRVKRDRGPDSLARRTLSGIMQMFSDRVRANGATPIWVVFPIDDILENEVSKYKEISDYSIAEAKRLSMPVLDLEPYFREYLKKNPGSPPLWRPADIGGHLSAEGNKVAAQAIYTFLHQQSLLKK